jgi:hypothetical protein
VSVGGLGYFSRLPIGYGFPSVVLVLYLIQGGLSQTKIGLLLTLTLMGDRIISLSITANADRGGLKIIYDLLLYRNFLSIKPPEEKK